MVLVMHKSFVNKACPHAPRIKSCFVKTVIVSFVAILHVWTVHKTSHCFCGSPKKPFHVLYKRHEYMARFDWQLHETVKCGCQYRRHSFYEIDNNHETHEILLLCCNNSDSSYELTMHVRHTFAVVMKRLYFIDLSWLLF